MKLNSNEEGQRYVECDLCGKQAYLTNEEYATSAEATLRIAYSGFIPIFMRQPRKTKFYIDWLCPVCGERGQFMEGRGWIVNKDESDNPELFDYVLKLSKREVELIVYDL